MINETVHGNKDLGDQDPILDSIDSIFVIHPIEGEKFSGRLLQVQGDSLLFERRNGTRILIHRNSISRAFELAPRRP